MRKRLVWDTFSHTETNQWGSPETTWQSQTWLAEGGAATDFSVAGGVGKHSMDSVNVNRRCSAGSAIRDFDITVKVTCPVVAATAAINAQLMGRYVDGSNHYRAGVAFDTAGNVDLTIVRVLAGASTTLGTANDVTTYSAGSTVWARFQGVDTNLGVHLRAKVWLTTEDEPDWDLEDIIDYTPELVSGAAGLRSILSNTNTNTLPVVLSYDEFTCYQPADWIDVTNAVLIAQGLGQPINGSVGRATELAQIDESNLGFAVKNLSGWFTPDNTLSPYYPDWKTGTPLRWSETFGARSFIFPDMFLEIPEVTISFERENHPEQSDRTLRLSAVDLLTRLKNAPRFISNIAAHVVGQHKATLYGYWPLLDAAEPFANTAGGAVMRTLFLDSTGVGTVVAIPRSSPAEGGTITGDDLPGVLMQPAHDGTDSFASRAIFVTYLSSVPVAAGQVATIMCWANLDIARDETNAILSVAVGDGLISLFTRDSTTGYDVRLTKPTGTVTGSVNGTESHITGPGWHLFGFRFGVTPNVLDLWVDDRTYTGTLSGSLSSTSVEAIEIAGFGLQGTVSHCQFYVGDPDDFTNDDFVAQFNLGVEGFPQQTVDARIRMIGEYAGLVDGQMDLEESQSLIQPPAFAGQRPGVLASAAAVTGGGILFTATDRLVYHDRTHRFNL